MCGILVNTDSAEGSIKKIVVGKSCDIASGMVATID